MSTIVKHHSENHDDILAKDEQNDAVELTESFVNLLSSASANAVMKESNSSTILVEQNMKTSSNEQFCFQHALDTM
ncbi:unnamed protein product [Strongylus vulgaris]|uniref:Uncharacterized protein n=1 Tax=Strongylus vulgaris TaxID=40348 RepID=A0A3P7IZJ0_STRVU|nr:unnamed protein product [Strongylus vulgaris]